MPSRTATLRTVGEIAERNLVILDENTLVGEAAKEMQKNGLSSVLVSRKDLKEPLGIATERDILYRVIAQNAGPFKITLKDIMTYPLLTIDESTSVMDAIDLMKNKEIRRLPVTKGGRIEGLITLMSAIQNMPEQSTD